MALDMVLERRKERLAELVAQKFGGSKAALGRALGYRDGAFIGQMLRGERAITEKTISQIHELPAGSDWFVVLDEAHRSPAAASTGPLSSNVEIAVVGTIKIPLISYVQAGVWTEVVDSFNPGDADDWLLTDLELSGHAFALQIKGNSMLPDFNPGDRVIIDPAVAPQPGDFVVAKNGQEEATFKKYRPRSTDAAGNTIFELVPLNEDYASIRSDVTPVKIVGTMVEHRKYRRPR